jgi:integrase
MAGRKPHNAVALYIRILTAENKQPYCRPVTAKNGRIKPLWAMVNGNEERHPEGSYYLRYVEAGQRKFVCVGSDADKALAEQIKQRTILQARSHDLEVNDPNATNTTRVRVADAVAEYVEGGKRKSRRTLMGRKHLMAMFQESCGKLYMDQIDRRDILNFTDFLRARGLGDRSVFNAYDGVKAFCNANHIRFVTRNGVPGIMEADDTPKYTEKTIAAYNEDELKALFAAATPDERLVFQFFVGSGAREQEVAHACYRDLNFSDKTLRITDKPQWGFKPKDSEERNIPLPDALIKALQARRRQHPGDDLIFPNGEGRPEGHFLRILKKAALRGGMNCGHCVNKAGQSCKDHPVCSKFELHKFRKTFATLHHESGISARTLQAWLGHSDLETTLCYLEIANMRSARTRAQVNKTFAALD